VWPGVRRAGLLRLSGGARRASGAAGAALDPVRLNSAMLDWRSTGAPSQRLQRSSCGQRPTAAFPARAGLLGVWLQLNVSGFPLRSGTRLAPGRLSMRTIGPAPDLRKLRDEQGNYLRKRHRALCGSLLNPRTIYRWVTSKFFIHGCSMTKNILVCSMTANFLPVEDRTMLCNTRTFRTGNFRRSGAPSEGLPPGAPSPGLPPRACAGTAPPPPSGRSQTN